MSAITGIYYVSDSQALHAQGNSLMMSLWKYPADAAQTWCRGNVFLGCHAQWITPESVGEKLPLYDAERKLAITADAIIDNRKQLFDLLQVEQGMRATMTDSALILLAYDKWKEDAPKYLVGDFAFMIWDERRNRLFGARDFSGCRTLYFHHSAQRFAFCTTIEPLFSLPGVEQKLNEQWTAEFLAIMATTDAVDPASTVYRNIGQLPPSHRVIVADGKMTLSRYCSISAGETLRLKSNEEYEEAFHEVFQNAVKARIRTYRKVGAQLSGGLDSGSVASFAARMLHEEQKQLHTFSYVPLAGFADWTPKGRIADERAYIQSTLDYTDHITGNITSTFLDFPQSSPYSEVDDMLDLMEMPYKYYENSFWLKGIYAEAHKQGMGVILNGQRGNWTVSWGPALEYQAGLLKRMKWLDFYRETRQYSRNIGVSQARVWKFAGRKAFPGISHLFQRADNPVYPMLINANFAKRMNVFAKLAEHGFNQPNFATYSAYEARKQQFNELNIWSLTGTAGTRMSLRYGLWERDPTNDLNVIRFCLSLPERQCVQKGVDRSLIRRATAHYLPDNVRLNQRTRGVQGADGVFRMSDQWDDFIEESRKLLVDPTIAPFLNVAQLKAALAKISAESKAEYIYDFDFRILMRAIIFNRFMKRLAGEGGDYDEDEFEAHLAQPNIGSIACEHDDGRPR